jgi:TonB family protein
LQYDSAIVKPYIFLAVIAVAAAPLPRAWSEDSAQHLLDTALQQEHFLQSATVPYALDAEVTAQMNGAIQGHFRFRWQSTDHWWSRIDLGPFQQIEIRNGEMEYTARNSEFTPLRVGELFALLHLNDVGRAQLKAGKHKKRRENGLAVVCVQGRDPNARITTREICVDEASRELVSDVLEIPSSANHVEQFSGYTEFKGAYFPTHLELKNGDQSLISVKIAALKPMPFEPALLESPKGAIVRRKCPDLKFPKLLAPTTIDFGLNRPGRNAEATVSLTVLADGTVSGIHLVGSGGEILDEAAVSAVEHWRFAPAMCGNKPVAYDTKIVISY